MIIDRGDKGSGLLQALWKKGILRVAALSLLFVFFEMAPSAGKTGKDGGSTFELASIFSDNMVLQRDSYVPVWGWAEEGAKITLRASWSKQKFTTTAMEGGEWLIALPTPEAGGPHTIHISCSEPSVKSSTEVDLVDVMTGEVWICSGQSNMDIPLRGYGFQRINGALDAVLSAPAYADRIRIFKVQADTSDVRLEDVDAVWKKASTSSVADISALGYFFARRITEALDVPVGIIVNAWGGSKIEAWLPEECAREAVDAETFGKISAYSNKADGYPEKLGSVYNSRVYPLREYGARGFLWYQGCSNVGDHLYYNRLMEAMADRWREDWSDDKCEMPFLFVTIAPYDYGNADGIDRPLFVEAQLKALDMIPNSFAAVSETYGLEHVIHPPFKQELADQLASFALAEVYGMDLGINWYYPEPGEIKYTEGGAEVSFDKAWSSLGEPEDRHVDGFELSGPDRVFHRAEAYVKDDGNTVVVTCGEVPDPVALRYSFRNFIPSNLRNAFGIPVPPFRTDDW